MLRPTTAIPAAALALLAGACGPGEPDEPARRPDAIVVVIDTLRSDRLGMYGYPRETSPFLDSLAAEGVLFEDATAQAAWTLPSMVSFHQSTYITEYRDVLIPERTSLAESFQRAGYDTIGVVSNLGMGRHTGFTRGFKWFDNRRARDAAGKALERPRSAEETLADLRVHLDHAASVTPKDAERNPAFVYVHLMDPHQPHDAYPELNVALPPTDAAPPMPWDWQLERFAADGPAPPRDDADWEERWSAINRDRGRYDQSVRHTDDVLRELFDELRGRGLLDHAVVVVASDHGEGLWERVSLFGDPELYAQSPPDEFFHAEHGSMVTGELVRTPLLFWGAGVPEGVRVATPVENVDVLPTMLELCDVAAATEPHGRSLVGAMRGADDAREAVFTFSHNECAVREVATGLKLIAPNPWKTRAEVEPQLYDERADPAERRNLIAERPDDAARLARMLAEWRERFPTATTMDSPLDPEHEAALRGLGYTADEIGR